MARTFLVARRGTLKVNVPTASLVLQLLPSVPPERR